MAQFIALDSNVEAKGAAIMSVVAGLGNHAIPILKKYDLYPIDVEGWYKQQNWLDAFREVAQMNFMSLVAIGMKIPDNATWPPDIKTAHDALASIDVAYQMNHRGGKIGGYHYKVTGNRSGEMMCDNPYPSDFDYGIIYRTVQKFRTDTDEEKTGIIVKRNNDIPNRLTGAEQCIYTITW